jgi:membrane protease YdiL (CAAX protease family)
VRDTWLGLGLFLVMTLVIIAAVVLWADASFIQNTGLILLEFLYLLPVILIMGWKRAPWYSLGFRRFDKRTFETGCGLLVGAYMVIIAHNTIMSLAGFLTQGDQVFQLFLQLENPLVFILVGTVLAPLCEEIFFRGFLFNGFRGSYGWKKAGLLSSAFFSLAHLDPVALIPTFILGYLLAYLFHKSNSLWPGIIIHFLVNSFGICMVYAVMQIPM